MSEADARNKVPPAAAGPPPAAVAPPGPPPAGPPPPTGRAGAAPVAAEAAVPAAAGAPLAGAGPAVEYDWGTPRRFTRAERERLAAFALKVGARLAAELGTLLRRPIALDVGAVTESYGEPFAALPPESLHTVALADSAGKVRGMMGLAPGVALAWVEGLLGGTAAAEVSPRPLTSLEEVLLLDISRVLGKTLAAAAKEAGGPALQAADRLAETSPLADLSREECCAIALKTSPDAPSPGLLLVLASDLVAPIADPDSLKRAARTAEDRRRHLLRHLEGVPVSVTACLGATSLSMREVMALEPGDVLVLPRRTDEPIDVLSMGSVVVRGVPVICDGRYGVQVADARQWPRLQTSGKEPDA